MVWGSFEQKDFVEEILRKYNGKLLPNNLFNGHPKWSLDCPNCHRPSGMIGYTKDLTSFLFACPACQTRMNLHNLIQEYGGDDMIKRWKNERYKNTHPIEQWLPIKNRKTGKKNTISFREKMDAKSSRLMIYMGSLPLPARCYK